MEFDKIGDAEICFAVLAVFAVGFKHGFPEKCKRIEEAPGFDEYPFVSVISGEGVFA